MRSTERQRNKIIDLLKTNYVYGVNSKVFYNNNIYRYPQRMQELRKRGYVFASVNDPIGDAEFDRFWIVSDPYRQEKNNYVPKRAKIWGATGTKKKSASKQKYQYEFDPVSGMYNAYPVM